MTSEGAAALAATGLSTRAIALAVGASAQSVSRWLRGEKRPGPDMTRALQRTYGIDPRAWSRRPTAPAKRTPSRPSRPTTRAPSLIEADATQLRELAAELRKARSEPDIAPDVLAKIAAVESRVLAELDRRRTTHERIVESAEWRELEGRILAAVEPHPLAFGALLVALAGAAPLAGPPKLVAAVERAEAELWRAIRGAS